MPSMQVPREKRLEHASKIECKGGIVIKNGAPQPRVHFVHPTRIELSRPQLRCKIGIICCMVDSICTGLRESINDQGQAQYDPNGCNSRHRGECFSPLCVCVW